ncbi:MAG TPA: alpha/beta hydrolase [Streptosporangiaceae bacterium]|jgi:pimeloyl-ACP methyl ester carboxylesterase|nr:alpha/beta hydrolase [Streptosporangiaceae bacterium]
MTYFQASDGTSLFYRDWGTGRPVLFVSSWGFSSAMWQYQMIALAEAGLRCIAYDRRGHGRSDDPGRGYTADALADDLAGLIDHLDLRELTLVGHSMGGAEIIRYLTRHGDDQIGGIALVAAALPFPRRTADNPDGIDDAAAEEVRRAWKRDLPGWVAQNAAPFFGVGFPGCDTSPALQDWAVRELGQASLQALVECNKAAIETDFRAEMREVRVPALIIHGDRDVSCPVEITGTKSARLIPHGRLVVYENAPHGIYLTHRDRLCRDLLDFAKR